MSFFNPDEIDRPAFVLFDQSRPGNVPWHSHQRAQLIYVSEGVLTVYTDQGIWVVPSHRAVWVLPGIQHRTRSSRPYSLCTLYLDSSLAVLPAKCAVVEVTPLVRELLLAASRFGSRYEKGSSEDRLIRLVLESLPMLPLSALHLPEPKDDRLKYITERLTADPADNSPLSTWAQSAGLSQRTAERLFMRELGMTFGKWRQQLRLLLAMEKLADDEKVTRVAFDVGYADVSAFIAMFKSSLGATPKQYFRHQTK